MRDVHGVTRRHALVAEVVNSAAPGAVAGGPGSTGRLLIDARPQSDRPRPPARCGTSRSPCRSRKTRSCRWCSRRPRWCSGWIRTRRRARRCRRGPSWGRSCRRCSSSRRRTGCRCVHVKRQPPEQMNGAQTSTAGIEQLAAAGARACGLVVPRRRAAEAGAHQAGAALRAGAVGAGARVAAGRTRRTLAGRRRSAGNRRARPGVGPRAGLTRPAPAGVAAHAVDAVAGGAFVSGAARRCPASSSPGTSRSRPCSSCRSRTPGRCCCSSGDIPSPPRCKRTARSWSCPSGCRCRCRCRTTAVDR